MITSSEQGPVSGLRRESTGGYRLSRAKVGIAQLNPHTREIFLMHRLDGLKYQEIAHHLGISQGAVEKHIARASLFLTDWIEGW